jgi:nicotinamidase/pyrazinamidase
MSAAAHGDYDPHTALVVVDVQNDFADPQGSLYVPGAEQAVEAINREVDAAHQAASLVVYTQDWHPASTPHFEKDGGVWPTHCVQRSWGAQLYEPLRVVDGPVVRKGTEGEDGYSAFSVRDPQSGEEAPTELEAMLRDRRVARVVIVGLAQDVCVKETVLDAERLGFDATVITDATRPVDLQPGDGERALQTMAAAGAALR